MENGCSRRGQEAACLNARAAPNDYVHYHLIPEQESAFSARCMCAYLRRKRHTVRKKGLVDCFLDK